MIWKEKNKIKAEDALRSRIRILKAAVDAHRSQVAHRQEVPVSKQAQDSGARGKDETAGTDRQLNLCAAILSMAVLGDSGLQHYRGSFENRAMYTPLLVSSLTLGASLFGVIDRKPRAHLLRDGIYALAAGTACVGLGFHVYNVTKRPGGLSWLNLFYGAPVGAPIALLLAGLLGRGAERIRDAGGAQAPTILGRPAGRVLAAVAAGGLLGTAGEAGLLHFRGSFQNPAMYLPVTIPPAAAALTGIAAAYPGHRTTFLARVALRVTAALGLAGVVFHAYGISRAMGGWRNWSQNILNGPPLPAPPSFTSLALAGLAALRLMERDHHE